MMISCKQATELASKRLDANLSLFQRFNLKLHLFLCHHCRRYVRQLRFIHKALPRMERYLENDNRRQLSPKAQEKIAAAIEQHTQSRR